MTKDALGELAAMRENYLDGALRRENLDACPLVQFSVWLKAYEEMGSSEVNACTLATAKVSGEPSVRAVLLKGVEDGGFVFFTNYESRKSKELDENPNAAMHFPWWSMERQVSVEGIVERLDEELAASYFSSRPLESRLGAWASRQSRVLDSRKILEKAFDEMAERFGDNPPKPDFWGGYKLIPQSIEFWQGRAGRLHDRFVYRREGEGRWRIERLYP